MGFINSYRFKPSSSCPSYNPGLYTAEEIDTFVFVDGFIPVANISEFKLIGTAGSRTMGAGTCWAGTYTTGLEKKYIQVQNVNAVAEVGWTPVPIGDATPTMIYDGNNLLLQNLTATQGWLVAQRGIIRNCKVSNTVISGGVGNDGILIDTNSSGALVVDSCEVLANCSISTAGSGSTGVGGICGTSNTASTIQNCINRANVTTTASVSGGICGLGSPTITNCINYGNVTGTQFVAGILGQHTTGTLTTCQNYGIITGNNLFVGGITSRSDGSAIIQDCINGGNIVTSTTRVGGITGGLLGGAAIVRRCKTIDCTISSSANSTQGWIGGICGYVVNGTGVRPLIEECYVQNTGITAALCDEVGGICGTNFNTYLTIRNCRVDEATVIAARSRVGGIMGFNDSGLSVFQYSYSAAQVTGTTSVGGVVGGSTAGTYTDIYWDITVGPPVSAAGTSQTTVALQTPTSNTGIYSAWSLSFWNFGTTTEYPRLINVP